MKKIKSQASLDKIVSFIKRRPKGFILLALLVFFFFTTLAFWFKLNGQTLSLPFLEKYVKVAPDGTPNTVTKEQFDKYTPIIGDYKYRCKPSPKNHGGICHIQMIPTDNGLPWKLTGERKWEELKDSDGTRADHRKILDIPYGGLMDDNKIAYRYKITKKDKHIEAYAEGTVVDRNSL